MAPKNFDFFDFCNVITEIGTFIYQRISNALRFQFWDRDFEPYSTIKTFFFFLKTVFFL